jgi:hypothetical protein
MIYGTVSKSNSICQNELKARKGSRNVSCMIYGMAEGRRSPNVLPDIVRCYLKQSFSWESHAQVQESIESLGLCILFALVS